MPIDTNTETAVPFLDAPKHIPGRPHISTLHRWRLAGVRGRRLETFLSGGRRFTSLEAIERFLRHDDAQGVGQPVPASADGQYDRRVEAAERQLEDLGI